jgi:hypothetical protein
MGDSAACLESMPTDCDPWPGNTNARLFGLFDIGAEYSDSGSDGFPP